MKTGSGRAMKHILWASGRYLLQLATPSGSPKTASKTTISSLPETGKTQARGTLTHTRASSAVCSPGPAAPRQRRRQGLRPAARCSLLPTARLRARPILVPREAGPALSCLACLWVSARSGLRPLGRRRTQDLGLSLLPLCAPRDGRPWPWRRPGAAPGAGGRVRGPRGGRPRTCRLGLPAAAEHEWGCPLASPADTLTDRGWDSLHDVRRHRGRDDRPESGGHGRAGGPGLSRPQQRGGLHSQLGVPDAGGWPEAQRGALVGLLAGGAAPGGARPGSQARAGRRSRLRGSGLGLRGSRLPGVARHRQTAVRHDASLQPGRHGGTGSRSAHLRAGADGPAPPVARRPVLGGGHGCRIPVGEFRPGHRAGDVLPHWALHQPVLVMLPEHRCLPAGHPGRRHAHLERPAPAGGLHSPSRDRHQPLPDRTLSPRAGQRLCGVAVLRVNPSTPGPSGKQGTAAHLSTHTTRIDHVIHGHGA